MRAGLALAFGLFFAGFFNGRCVGGRGFFSSRGFFGFGGNRAAFGHFFGDRGRVFGGRVGRGFVGDGFGNRFGGFFALHRTGRVRLSGCGSGGFLSRGGFFGGRFRRAFFDRSGLTGRGGGKERQE